MYRRHVKSPHSVIPKPVNFGGFHNIIYCTGEQFYFLIFVNVH